MFGLGSDESSEAVDGAVDGARDGAVDGARDGAVGRPDEGPEDRTVAEDGALRPALCGAEVPAATAAATGTKPLPSVGRVTVKNNYNIQREVQPNDEPHFESSLWMTV